MNQSGSCISYVSTHHHKETIIHQKISWFIKTVVYDTFLADIRAKSVPSYPLYITTSNKPNFTLLASFSPTLFNLFMLFILHLAHTVSSVGQLQDI